MKDRIKLIATIVLAFSTGALGTYLIFNSNTKTSSNIVKNVSEVEVVENSISTSVEKVYDAIVVVMTYKNQKVVATGTGFIYKKDEKNGYIITNNHVVDGGDNVKIMFNNGSAVDANVLGKETFSDIAVLTLDISNVEVIAPIGNSETMKLGDTVFTIGSPLGSEYKGTVTKGILSGKDRLVEVSFSGTSNDWIMKVLQTDAAINPGNSGGPLLNINGEVIGVNSLKLVKDEIEGMGFAIPIEEAMRYVEMLEKGEGIARPYVGIEMYDITETYYLWQARISVDTNIKSGVVVANILEKSPATEAGLQKGDVIFEINNVKVASKAQFRYELYKHKPGNTIEIKVHRGSEDKTLNLILIQAS